jgi:hypothetical protein
MTPVQFEALLFAFSVSSLGYLVLAYAVGWIRLPNERHPLKGREQVEAKGAALLQSWLNPEQSKLWGHTRYFGERQYTQGLMHLMLQFMRCVIPTSCGNFSAACRSGLSRLTTTQAS